MDNNIPENVKESINQLPASIKSQMLLVTDEQVHDELNKLINEIETSVQIVFRYVGIFKLFYFCIGRYVIQLIPDSLEDKNHIPQNANFRW